MTSIWPAQQQEEESRRGGGGERALVTQAMSACVDKHTGERERERKRKETDDLAYLLHPRLLFSSFSLSPFLPPPPPSLHWKLVSLSRSSARLVTAFHYLAFSYSSAVSAATTHLLYSLSPTVEAFAVCVSVWVLPVQLHWPWPEKIIIQVSRHSQ